MQWRCSNPGWPYRGGLLPAGRPVPVAAQLGRFAAVVRAEAERLGMPRLGVRSLTRLVATRTGWVSSTMAPGPDGGVPVGAFSLGLARQAAE